MIKGNFCNKLTTSICLDECNTKVKHLNSLYKKYIELFNKKDIYIIDGSSILKKLDIILETMQNNYNKRLENYCREKLILEKFTYMSNEMTLFLNIMVKLKEDISKLKTDKFYLLFKNEFNIENLLYKFIEDEYEAFINNKYNELHPFNIKINGEFGQPSSVNLRIINLKPIILFKKFKGYRYLYYIKSLYENMYYTHNNLSNNRYFTNSFETFFIDI